MRGGERAIRTWRVGEVGMEGTRRVLPGGVISVCGITYQCAGLLSFVGEVVCFWDDDPTPEHGECRWDERLGREIRSIRVGGAIWHLNGRVSMSSEPFLGRAWETGVDEKGARRLQRAIAKRRERRQRRTMARESRSA